MEKSKLISNLKCSRRTGAFHNSKKDFLVHAFLDATTECHKIMFTSFSLHAHGASLVAYSVAGNVYPRLESGLPFYPNLLIN
jgi:hypothetical protein